MIVGTSEYKSIKRMLYKFIKLRLKGQVGLYRILSRINWSLVHMDSKYGPFLVNTECKLSETDKNRSTDLSFVTCPYCINSTQFKYLGNIEDEA